MSQYSAAILGMVLVVFCMSPLPGVQSDDWPQFLGPTRDGIYAGKVLSQKWPQSGLKVLWQRTVGQGFANPIVVGKTLILFHRVGDQDVVEALATQDGTELWKFSYPTTYRDDFGFDEGPRASPAASQNHVYTYSAQGILHCLSLPKGRMIWRVDTRSRFKARKGFFGTASSPLIWKDYIYLHVGAKKAGIVAFDRYTGRTLWTATNDEAGYSSPVQCFIKEKPYIISFTRNGLVSTDSVTGRVGFRIPWRSRSHASVNAATPLIIGKHLFLSASYGTGALLLKLTGAQPQKIWSSDDSLSNHYSTSVHRDGYLYGFHGRQEYGPSLRCIELKTGRVRWTKKGFGAGTITMTGTSLLILTEKGELVLVKATPKLFQIVSRCSILESTVRAYPAIAQGLLYARNEKTLICVDLRK